ncbi:hypothetical protein [Trinickia sp. Y13]|uniref:hypothetical protein n=1 Tax=Trinickia sp. Y13 TaxID=2917807 RepID=UPI002406CB12|nr:hypothetical protein [Trinickia sp. Y13]MDG0023872.1 hypothetical protein [Trinickia sp. Y13]
MRLMRCAMMALGFCAAMAAAVSAPAWAAGGEATSASADGRPANDYPTQGRVEYVLSCMDENGHAFANVYKCSCVVDKMAASLSYDQFVDESTFARYASLGGEGGAEFRTDHARARGKAFRALQAKAYRACGLGMQAVTAAK